MIYGRESYEAYHQDLFIGHLKHLDAALVVLWFTDAKSYGVHDLDLVIGHLEDLDSVLYGLWILNKRIV